MIHLAGNGMKDSAQRALDETAILEENDFDAIIIENYHGRERLQSTSIMRRQVIVGSGVKPYKHTEIQIDVGLAVFSRACGAAQVK